MNCQDVRTTIDAASKREPVNDSVKAHVNGCPDCRLYGDQTQALLALLKLQPKVEAPADFDFRLRARIARAQSEQRSSWAFIERFRAKTFSLGQALTVTATLALVATFTAVHISNNNQPVTNNHESSASAVNSQQSGTPKIITKENLSPAPLAVSQSNKPAAPKNIAGNMRLAPVSERPAAIEVSRVQTRMTSSTASNEDIWRAYNAEKGQVIATPNRPTLIGAETSTSTMAKTVAFVPSI